MVNAWVTRVAVALLAPVLAGPLGPGALAAERPERGALRVGLVAPAAVFLPLYLAADRTAGPEGLRIELLTFRGGSVLAQALAADSVDVALMALGTAIHMLDSGHAVRVFYGGLSQADNEWFARPGIGSWAEVRGHLVGVSRFGGLFEAMTRHVLRKHGLEAGRDVQLVAVGPSPTALSALSAGRVDVAFLGPPAKWQAESRGFVRLGTEAAEIAPEWPKNLFVAKAAFLAGYPGTVRALLRAHVRGIRLARADPPTAIEALVRHLKYEPTLAARAYDEVVRGLNERGSMPASGLEAFWRLAIAGGEVTRRWPAQRFLDVHLIDGFEEWAPQ
jgi:NitT/TauT family transport system substrate-binding protein